jgi:hypothetical protein
MFAMKTPLQPGFVMPKAVMALCVLGACATSAFAQQYPPQQPKPRVGTRFLNFVKDLVWGEEPDNRYQGYAPPPNSAPTHRYGAQGGRRYNLDSPPPVADYDGAAYQQQQPQYQVPPPSRPAQQPSQAQHQNQNHLSQPQPYQQQEARDMPYSTPRQEKEKAPEPAQAQRREAVQEQPPAPVKQKPRVEEHKKVEESPPQSQPQSKGGLFSRKSEQPKKEVEESLPESKPQKTTNPKTVTETPKNDPPAETPKETVVASNNAPKDKGADTPSPASSGATLTGTRTTKAGLVKSPYPPYNELDVTGLPTGSLAMDPTTGKVFRVP